MSSEPAVASTTVLLVDDDDGVRMVTRLLLERAGFTVLAAQDGREGIAVLRDHLDSVDVVLLDVMMPQMTGHEALPRMRELRPDIPVIFFSGYAESEVADHLGPSTAYTSFLPKPGGLSTLSEAIARAVRN